MIGAQETQVRQLCKLMIALFAGGWGAFFETGSPVSQTGLEFSYITKDDLEFPIPAELAFQIATSVVVQAGLKLIIFLFHPPEFWDLAKSFKGRPYKSDTTQKKSSSKPLLSLPYLGFPLGLSLGSKAWPSCWS